MNYRMIGRVLGLILLIYAALMLLPLIAGLCFRESPLPFLGTMAAAAVPGGLLLLLSKPEKGSLVARDGFVIVGLGWILISLIGALPFVLSGSMPHYIDALFETVSGLTTTGATVLSNFDGMPRGVMFWRVFTHWIGGMGVLVFLMAVLPMSGEHSMHIMRAEVPGPTVGKLVPRVRHTARILYMIYIALTLVEALVLLMMGMSFYDALLHAFSTAGTGGFSTMSNSISGFRSQAIETVLGVFMILFGLNFNLYYLILISSVGKALKNEELRDFLLLIAASVLVIACSLWREAGYSFRYALHDAFFNPADVLRRLRRQHRRRHQALQADDPLQVRDGGSAAYQPAAQRGPGPAGRSARGGGDHPGNLHLCVAVCCAAHCVFAAPLPGREGHRDLFHGVAFMPLQRGTGHDPDHRARGKLCVLHGPKQAPAVSGNAAGAAGDLPDSGASDAAYLAALSAGRQQFYLVYLKGFVLFL